MPLKMQEKINRIQGVVNISLSDVIDNDLEGLLDILNERLTECTLMDIEYRVVGVSDDGKTLQMHVSGIVDEV